jgi:hypothetical protein
MRIRTKISLLGSAVFLSAILISTVSMLSYFEVFEMQLCDKRGQGQFQGLLVGVGEAAFQIDSRISMIGEVSATIKKFAYSLPTD